MQEDSLTNNSLLKEGKFLDSYFLKEYSSSTPLFPDDSKEFHSFQPELKHENLSLQPQISDWVFCIFLILFVSFSNIGKKIGILRSIGSELLVVKERKSIFYEPTENEWYGKLLLGLQTCILTAIFLYKYFAGNSAIVLNTPTEVLIFIGKVTLVLCCFVFIKWCTYNLVGAIFFDKSGTQIWINNYFSILAFSGIVLFIPILLYFYVDFINYFYFYFIIIYFILFEVFIMYKSFVLFFQKPSRLLNLFLYLCAQEIIPLFFLWETMVRMFNFVEK